jgi:hypothetical protein
MFANLPRRSLSTRDKVRPSSPWTTQDSCVVKWAARVGGDTRRAGVAVSDSEVDGTAAKSIELMIKRMELGLTAGILVGSQRLGVVVVLTLAP